MAEWLNEAATGMTKDQSSHLLVRGTRVAATYLKVINVYLQLTFYMFQVWITLCFLQGLFYHPKPCKLRVEFLQDRKGKKKKTPQHPFLETLEIFLPLTSVSVFKIVLMACSCRIYPSTSGTYLGTYLS